MSEVDLARRVTGFTLIELLVVIAIIAILAAILLPVFMEAKAKGRDVKCMSNLHQLGVAFMTYNDNWNNRYMPAAGYSPPNNTWYQRSFAYLLQPYIKNRQVLLCPSGPKKSKDYYAGPTLETDWEAPDSGWWWNGDPAPQPLCNYGNNIYMAGYDAINGGWGPRVPTEGDVKRPSRIIYLIDARWVDLLLPGVPGRIGRAKNRHHGGAMAVCCDGHAQWFPVSKIDEVKYWNYLTN